MNLKITTKELFYASAEEKEEMKIDKNLISNHKK